MYQNLVNRCLLVLVSRLRKISLRGSPVGDADAIQLLPGNHSTESLRGQPVGDADAIQLLPGYRSTEFELRNKDGQCAVSVSLRMVHIASTSCPRCIRVYPQLRTWDILSELPRNSGLCFLYSCRKSKAIAHATNFEWVQNIRSKKESKERTDRLIPSYRSMTSGGIHMATRIPEHHCLLRRASVRNKGLYQMIIYESFGPVLEPPRQRNAILGTLRVWYTLSGRSIQSICQAQFKT